MPDIYNGKMLSVAVLGSSKIELTPTSYHSFLLTNYLADDPEWQQGIDQHWPGRVENRETLLSDSIRANPLSVHLNLIRRTGNDYSVLVSRRSDTNANAPSTYGHTAGGSMDISDLYGSSSETIARVATRELKEELGIDLRPQDLSVVDIFVSSKVLDPVAVAVAIVSERQILTWTTGAELLSATWCKIADVQIEAQLKPWAWHYDTLDDMAATVNFLDRHPM
ncbi:NUDIX domain-containing protein [Ferrimicrobium acidiphilum]|uniref:NUDIX domain-containing protein n=2 Tax=Ferrimicrobium acidiphilum TaxID=121039 RepID=A0ABV3Y4X3_9ACTN